MGPEGLEPPPQYFGHGAHAVNGPPNNRAQNQLLYLVQMTLILAV